MDFAFSEEQEQLRSFTREFLADNYDDERIASIADSDTGVDEGVWGKLAEMGWLDEELTFLDRAVLFEETGYRLLPAPYFSTTALAGPTLRQDGELAGRLGRGGLRSTLAWAEDGVPQGLLDLDAVSASASDGTVTGRKVLVPDAGAVDLFVVVAKEPSGDVGLHAVEAGAARVSPQEAIDGTRRLGGVRFEAATARPLAIGAQAHALLSTTRDTALAAAALEGVGVAQRALDLLIDYAKTREQFGKPVGVYQAVSHKAANVYLELQEARSLAYWAAWCVAEDDAMASQACLAAKSQAGHAAVFACEQAIQGHGGIGFTWEHVLHRYYKRAQWVAAFDGSARRQRAEIASALLD